VFYWTAEQRWCRTLRLFEWTECRLSFAWKRMAIGHERSDLAWEQSVLAFSARQRWARPTSENGQLSLANRAGNQTC
jgi:hypothetical protein